MAPVYSGALQPKKKSELQEIAEALSLATTGTKDDLQTRIKDHLDVYDHSHDPQFGGLYVWKRKTRKEEVAPASNNALVGSDDETPGTVGRKGSIRRKASMPTPPVNSFTAEGPITPHQMLPPSSPIRDLVNTVEKAISTVAPDTDRVVEAVRRAESGFHVALAKARTASQSFFSNAKNIFTVTVVVELLYVLHTIIPWQYQEFFTLPYFDEVFVPYIPFFWITSIATWKLLAKWSVVTYVLPQLAGYLISFTTPRKHVDPVSAAIVKLALCSLAPATWFILFEDDMWKWRITGSAINAAFAFAEAIEARRVVTRGV